LIQFEHVEDLLATALKMEIGAADRYMEYAETASTENPEIAALFIRLAEEEREHEKNVLQLAEEASVDLSNAVVSEQLIQSANKEETAKANDTLHSILAGAVIREERAFEIYSQIAASSSNENVRHYAEIMAKEELGHAALLRSMRRRVYEEHMVQTTKILPDPVKLASLEEFLITAYILETSLATYIRKIADSGIDMSSSRDHSEFIINQLEDDIIRSTNNVNLNINEFDTIRSKKTLPNIDKFTLTDLFIECEFVYEYYDSVVSETGNEDIMEKALFLASQTLSQLILLQNIKNNIGDK
jgi:rubrerythrin